MSKCSRISELLNPKFTLEEIAQQTSLNLNDVRNVIENSKHSGKFITHPATEDDRDIRYSIKPTTYQS